MSGPTLTEKQAACLAPSRNRMVSAGAGSGKTFLLVQKIMNLFCGESRASPGIGVENLLALTFTRKAAGEMRTRVYRELLHRIEQEEEARVRDHLVGVKERFQLANISTIHGFAASLIRSNPVTASVDPDFEVLDDADKAALITAAVRTALRDRWNARDEAVSSLLELWEPFQLRVTIESLLARPIEFQELVATREDTDVPDLLRQIRENKWAAFVERLNEPDGPLTNLAVISDFCKGILDGRGKARITAKDEQKALRLVSEFVGPLTEALAADSPEDLDLSILNELRQKVKEIGTFRWEAPTAIAMLKELEAETRPWFELLDRDLDALKWTDNLIEVALDAYERYQAEKRRLSALSHDDLLIAGHAMSRHYPNRARGALRHFLVDEFQDTDPTQWEMILALSRRNEEAPRNLFLVGDTKQAVYGFRGADHTVTSTARELLTRVDDDPDVELTLDENFRSLAAPLEFTNTVFSKIFESDRAETNPYAVPPQRLIPRREADALAEADSSVAFLVADAERTDPWVHEARAVVRFLKSVKNREIQRLLSIADLMEQGKPAVGILFRVYEPMTRYTGELLRTGLPFSVYHGRTFFQTPEVHSFVNLLSWLADPQDECALAGVLRSPLFSWTDSDLAALQLVSDENHAPLDKRLQGKAHSSDPILPSGLSAAGDLEILERLRRLSAHLSLSETIRAAIDATMAHIIFAKGPRGAQAGANIEKFLSMVRELETSGGATPQTVVASILAKNAAGAGDAEAESPSEHRGAIQLMTIHAAKGLEFPLVIPACSGRRTGGAPGLFARRICLSDQQDPDKLKRLTLVGIDYPDKDRELPPSPTILKALLKEHAALQDVSEEERLLYVALTRAGDHLLIPLCVTEDAVVAAKSSHARFLLDAAPDIESAVLEKAPSVDLHEMSVDLIYDRSDSGEDRAVIGLQLKGQAEEIREAQFPGPTPTPQIGEMPFARKMRVSVTDLMTFRKCPRRFYFEKFLPGAHAGGLGFESPGVPDSEISTRPRASSFMAATRGTLVHAILEKFDHVVRDWRPDHAPPEQLTTELDRMIAGLKDRQELKGLGTDLRDSVLEHVRNVAASGVLERGVSHDDDSEMVVLLEAPFEIEADGFTVTGAVDRIERMPDRTWRVLDYKTTGIETRSREHIVKEEAYDLQIRFYAWAANLILNEPVSAAGIVFTGAAQDPLFPVDIETEEVDKTVTSILSEISQVLDKGREAFSASEKGRMCEECPCAYLELC